MKYNLINIGRSKFCGEIEANTEIGLHSAVSKHLMSNDVDLITDDDGKSFRVYAGMRQVGTVERIQA